jgi:hypothetical protein
MGRRDFSLRLRGEEKYHRPDMVILPVGSASASDWERERTAGTLTGTSDAVASRIAQGGLGGGATVADSGRAARPREQASQSDSFAPRVSAEAFVAEQLATVLEVELTAKGRNRLDEILAGWKTAVARGRFVRVRYYCPPRRCPTSNAPCSGPELAARSTPSSCPGLPQRGTLARCSPCLSSEEVGRIPTPWRLK